MNRKAMSKLIDFDIPLPQQRSIYRFITKFMSLYRVMKKTLKTRDYSLQFTKHTLTTLLYPLQRFISMEPELGKDRRP